MLALRVITGGLSGLTIKGLSAEQCKTTIQTSAQQSRDDNGINWRRTSLITALTALHAYSHSSIAESVDTLKRYVS